MNLALLYQEVEKRIEKVDFAAIWRGFSPLKFALYTDEECYFDGRYIEKTDNFCANTAIEHGSEYIAIWNVTEAPEDMDAFSASIIHEMFHAFQAISGESRFANEKEAPFKYRYSMGNLSAKRQEADCIKAILEQKDPIAYSRLLGLRKMRADNYPYEYEYEARVEQIEGTANFVEISALAQLNHEKGKLAWQKLLRRISQPENYFPIRIISYAIGATVIACIQKCSSMDFQAFTGQTFSREMISGVGGNGAKVPDDAEMENCLNHYLDETHRMIASAVSKNDCVLTGKYPLASVNIWDARCEGHYITSNHFVMYIDHGEYKTLSGNFVVQVDDDYNILTVFRQPIAPP